MNEAPCPLMLGTGPGRCARCDSPLVGQQTRWCCGGCREWYYQNHWYSHARRFVRRQARIRAGVYKCALCEKLTDEPEVDHIDPARSRHDKESCIHHIANLRVLCRACHLPLTKAFVKAEAQRRKEERNVQPA